MSSKGVSKKAKKISLKTDKVFIGYVLGVFEDRGPIARYNSTKLPKDLVTRMVIHGMSAVHGDEEILGGLFGPLPIIEKISLRYLIYSFQIKATNTKDIRIAEFGRVCSIFLILNEEQQKAVLNHHLTIEKILNEYKEVNWKKELDITNDSLIVLYEKINDVVKTSRLRAFSYDEAGEIEYADPQMILKNGIITIIDNYLKKAFMYLPYENFDSKNRIKAIEKIEELNAKEYSSRLEIIKYRDYLKFKKILDQYSIRITK